MRRIITLIILMLWAIENCAAFGPSEAALKAAYLYNFAKYTIWPNSAFPQPDTPLKFCIFNADEVARQLNSARARPIGAHSIDITIIDNLMLLNGCHLLYLGPQSSPSMQMLKIAYASNMLIVTEDPLSSTISFVPNGSKIGFAVDLDLANAAELSFSSELVKLAMSVRGKGRGVAP